MTAGTRAKGAPVITNLTTMTGAVGAFVVPACAEYTLAGHRDRSGIAGFGAVAPLYKGITLSSWTAVDNPTPVLVRYGGANG